MSSSFLRSVSDGAPENSFGEQHVVALENIPRDLLGPIVEAMAGGSVVDWGFDLKQGPEGTKGYYGYKLAPTFRWKRADGVVGSMRVCVKAGPTEALHYRGLKEAGFPVCRLFGFLRLEDGREVLFLEYLTNFQAFPDDDAGRRQWIGLRARLNAIRPAPWYDEELRRLRANGPGDSVGIGEKTGGIDVRAEWMRIIMAAKNGACGPEMSAICRDGEEWIGDVVRLAERVRERVRTMPLALSNLELNPAIRPGTKEVACVDLHSTALRPRASDVSQVLGRPGEVRDGWGEAWLPQEKWAEFYAEEYNRVSHSPVRAEEILEEARALWLFARLDQRWWLDRCQRGETGCCEDLASVASFLRLNAKSLLLAPCSIL